MLSNKINHFKVLKFQMVLVDEPGALDLLESKGRIIFSNVSFQYPQYPALLYWVLQGQVNQPL